MQRLWLAGFLVLTGFAHAPGAEPKPLKLPDGIAPDKLTDPKVAAKIADQIDKEYPAPQSEATKMLTAILRGSQLNGMDGWFGPAQSRNDFAWLAARAGTPDAKSLPRAR